MPFAPVLEANSRQDVQKESLDVQLLRLDAQAFL